MKTHHCLRRWFSNDLNFSGVCNLSLDFNARCCTVDCSNIFGELGDEHFLVIVMLHSIKSTVIASIPVTPKNKLHRSFQVLRSVDSAVLCWHLVERNLLKSKGDGVIPPLLLCWNKSKDKIPRGISPLNHSLILQQRKEEWNFQFYQICPDIG